jgi:ribokinase
MMSRPRIVVVGSINMDLVCEASVLPRPGETVMGQNFSEIPGGKGANQAVASARMGADVSMVGRVGDDAFGKTLSRTLVAEGIRIDHVQITHGCSSGLAMIGVESSGQNAITVISGANGRVTADDVELAEELFRNADVVLLQFEIPLPAILKAIELARRHKVFIILDPAPVLKHLPDDVFHVDVLCPNETEAEAITGLSVRNKVEALSAAQRIRDLGVPWTIITMGSSGAVSLDGLGCEQLESFPVAAVDSTGAGDTFAAGLAIAVASGLKSTEAVRFASAAAAISTVGRGAQSAMPTRNAVESLLSQSERITRDNVSQ